MVVFGTPRYLFLKKQAKISSFQVQNMNKKHFAKAADCRLQIQGVRCLTAILISENKWRLLQSVVDSVVETDKFGYIYPKNVEDIAQDDVDHRTLRMEFMRQGIKPICAVLGLWGPLIYKITAFDTDKEFYTRLKLFLDKSDDILQ